MTDLFENVGNVFGCMKDVCQGVQDVARISQNAVNDVQNVSRRTLNWGQQQQPTQQPAAPQAFQQTAMNPAYQQPYQYPQQPQQVAFTTYPGFWDESYGK